MTEQLLKRQLLGKTMLVRHDGRVLPVYCFNEDGEAYYGMQLRPKRYNDDIRSCWIVGVGNHGLREESVALTNRVRRFLACDVIRILGLVTPSILAIAQEKRSRIEQRPALAEERKIVLTKIVSERRKGHRTKGLNKRLKKLNRTLDGPTHSRAKPAGPTHYSKVNPHPMQGGSFSSK